MGIRATGNGRQPRALLKRARAGVAAVAIIAASLVVSELAFRAAIFSKAGFAKKFRNPALYFDYFADDRFWLANYAFGLPFGDPGMATHALLGWKAPSFTDSFEFPNREPLHGRRPVLLYGDSFAACSLTLPRCFEAYFNEDARFNGKCYFLNYGVGAHGIDQTYLTFKNSVDLYPNPVVVYSLMTMDLDRAALRVFLKQKPYFKIEGGRLVLSGLPIDPDVPHFFATHRPRTWSYLVRLLYRKWTHHNAMATDQTQRPAIEVLGRKILSQAIAELRARRLDFLIVVFVPNWGGESSVSQPDDRDWRLMTILSVLREQQVPYLVTKDVLKPILSQRPDGAASLFLPDGHPTEEQNRLIAEAIRQRLSPCLP